MTPIKKVDPSGEQRIVWAEVFAPNVPDAYGDYITPDDIKKMAYKFVKDGRLGNVDHMHKNETFDGVSIVETFIARDDDPTFIPGAWVVGVHIPNDELWDKVKKGEINGLSLEALALTGDQEVEIDVPPVLTGDTSGMVTTTQKDTNPEPNVQEVKEHTHKFFVSYDDEGKFMGGRTTVSEGHSHYIRGGTVTDEVNGHLHRFDAIDGFGDMRVSAKE